MTDILQRLKNSSKINGAYPADIADAIMEIGTLRETIAILNKACTTQSEGNARLKASLCKRCVGDCGSPSHCNEPKVINYDES